MQKNQSNFLKMNIVVCVCVCVCVQKKKRIIFLKFFFKPLNFLLEIYTLPKIYIIFK
jgi:hypothetical protein